MQSTLDGVTKAELRQFTTRNALTHTRHRITSRGGGRDNSLAPRLTVMFPIVLSVFRHFCIVICTCFTYCMYTLTFDHAIDNPFRWLLSNVLILIVPIALPQEGKRTPGGGMFYLVCYLVTVDQLAEVARLVVAENTPRNIKSHKCHNPHTHPQAL
jgi:hypothetical protein